MKRLSSDNSERKRGWKWQQHKPSTRLRKSTKRFMTSNIPRSKSSSPYRLRTWKWTSMNSVSMHKRRFTQVSLALIRQTPGHDMYSHPRERTRSKKWRNLRDGRQREQTATRHGISMERPGNMAATKGRHHQPQIMRLPPNPEWSAPAHGN